MENNQVSMMDLLIESHAGLERQGPGSPEITLKALGFLGNLDEISRVADMGCGTGGQTMVLAQNITGSIAGIDICPVFIDILNDNAKKLNLQERIEGIVGSIEELSFQKEELDLIWSEGVIDNIGFEKGLRYWNGFLKKNGFVAVTCPSWLDDACPDEVVKFWTDAGSEIDTVADNIRAMQRCGYSFVASFALPEECWTNNYFSPRQTAEQTLLEKYTGNSTVDEYIASSNYEIELYSKYKQHYGYVFYIGKKA